MDTDNQNFAVPQGFASPQSFRVDRCICYLFFAFDAGLAIDLAGIEKNLSAGAERTRFLRERRAPGYFDYNPPPLRITQKIDRIQDPRFETNSGVDLTLFDFGGISVCYSINYSGPLHGLVTISDALYGNKLLLADAKERVHQLVRDFERFIQKPQIAETVEDYTVYHIEELSSPMDRAKLAEDHAATLAQILRSETQLLSQDEITDALSIRVSYGQDDETIIDWNGSLVQGKGVQDVREVLEYTNMQLLEARILDERLDQDLAQAYQGVSEGGKRGGGRGIAADLRAVTKLHVEAAIIYESVNNALKLLGDQYLARVYALSAKRLHLATWNSSILRKLNAMDSIYQKMADQAGQRRAEFLEWIIILLITFEIVFSLIKAL